MAERRRWNRKNRWFFDVIDQSNSSRRFHGPCELYIFSAREMDYATYIKGKLGAGYSSLILKMEMSVSRARDEGA